MLNEKSYTRYDLTRLPSFRFLLPYYAVVLSIKPYYYLVQIVSTTGRALFDFLRRRICSSPSPRPHPDPPPEVESCLPLWQDYFVSCQFWRVGIYFTRVPLQYLIFSQKSRRIITAMCPSLPLSPRPLFLPGAITNSPPNAATKSRYYTRTPTALHLNRTTDILTPSGMYGHSLGNTHVPPASTTELRRPFRLAPNTWESYHSAPPAGQELRARSVGSSLANQYTSSSVFPADEMAVQGTWSGL